MTPASPQAGAASPILAVLAVAVLGHLGIFASSPMDGKNDDLCPGARRLEPSNRPVNVRR